MVVARTIGYAAIARELRRALECPFHVAGNASAQEQCIVPVNHFDEQSTLIRDMVEDVRKTDIHVHHASIDELLKHNLQLAQKLFPHALLLNFRRINAYTLVCLVLFQQL